MLKTGDAHPLLSLGVAGADSAVWSWRTSCGGGGSEYTLITELVRARVRGEGSAIPRRSSVGVVRGEVVGGGGWKRSRGDVSRERVRVGSVMGGGVGYVPTVREMRTRSSTWNGEVVKGA